MVSSSNFGTSGAICTLDEELMFSKVASDVAFLAAEMRSAVEELNLDGIDLVQEEVSLLVIKVK